MKSFRPHLWYLKKIDLFASLDENGLEAIQKMTRDYNIKKKTIIYSPSDILEKIYIIKEGEIILFKSHEGKKIIIDVLKPGSIFGALSCSHRTAGHFAETSEDSFLCAILRRDFMEILKRHTEIAMQVMCLFSDKIRQYEEKMRDLSLLNARQRVLHALHHLSEVEKKDILPEGLKKKTSLTHEKLAYMTGLTRETVTKVLIELTAEKAIKIGKGKKVYLNKNFVI